MMLNPTSAPSVVVEVVVYDEACTEVLAYQIGYANDLQQCWEPLTPPTQQDKVRSQLLWRPESSISASLNRINSNMKAQMYRQEADASGCWHELSNGSVNERRREVGVTKI